ncbi:MAG: efflux RND transporter periplasmic adaptor subunit [Bacteroidetes bacterium]|nr:efflux RND transporter periplasmic adaptor subunit [Bacteroidota bacterium]
MKKITNLRKSLVLVVLIAGGILAGYWIGNSNQTARKEITAPESVAEVHQHEGESAVEIWTCAMHPQIKMDKPGQCPICGMELIPLQKSDTEIDEQAIQLSESAIKLAEVKTVVVKKANATKELRLYGKIQVSENLLQTQTAHVSGRIEQLLINITGESVKKGQLIAKVYSPELINAQKELIEAGAMASEYPMIVEAAREKLRNMKVSEEQIRTIEQTAKVIQLFDIYANTSGVVVSLKVNVGDYINKGSVLFEVAELSRIWAVFDAYETDLPWISTGQLLRFSIQAVPGTEFTGNVSFIDPVIDPINRTAAVRVEVENQGLILKPGMFADGIVQSTTKSSDKLLIPRSAVLWTGTRSVVYVRLPNTVKPTFKMREIVLGASMGDAFVVLNGLNEGDEIVQHGTFSVDAAAQLAGKTSMMNPEGKKVSSGSMAGMDMGESQELQYAQQPVKDTAVHAMIRVYGNCEQCKDRIEGAVRKLVGVMTANWDENSKMLHLNYMPEKTSTDAVERAIAAVGHDTEHYTAKDSTYAGLPECCQYDRRQK